jgi:hypothetical protein
MSSWWSCPTCGRRLKFQHDRVWCATKRCSYDKPLPTAAPAEPTRGRW